MAHGNGKTKEDISSHAKGRTKKFPRIGSRSPGEIGQKQKPRWLRRDLKCLNEATGYDLLAIWSLSCSFLLAAMIISSLRFCKRRCLSLLFCDHALSWCKIVPVPVSVPASLRTIPESILEARSYRDMRS